LDIEVISKIAHARHRTLGVLSSRGAGFSIEEFRMEAARQLQEAFRPSAEF
jgi:hypothetical protein